MRRLRATALAALMAGSAAAADFSDPSWPCIQRKVENLSLGVMWPEPPQAPETDAAMRDLAEALALRRVSLEQAGEMVDAFAAARPLADRDAYGAVFAHLFERMNAERRRLIQGIGAYSRAQIALADRIEAARKRFDAIGAQAEPDFDALDALEAQLDWDSRIHRDRQKALTYVCETPVLIEKRVYALAQMLQAKAPQ